MSFFKFSANQFTAFALLLAMLFLMAMLAACRIEPLYKNNINSKPETKLAISQNLNSIFVAPVKNRIGQRVRNELIFSLGSNNKKTNNSYLVELAVSTKTQEHSILRGVRGATSANIEIKVSYKLLQQKNNEKKLLFKGARQALAGYDLTPQNFANQRAKLDAENRAAKTAAHLIRLALAQNFIELEKN